jgi:RHH-type rel operon transcriptional repressor/antitoxin RelB
MSVSISVRLPEEIARALEDLAKTTERPKTFLIRKALESYLAEYADYQIALERLRNKEDAVISGTELRKRLGILD